jgi:NitT/TauT family transport system substrate-binding protein
MSRYRAIAGWLLCCAVVLCAAGARADEALKKASFIPLWYPQAQFAGYYLALEKGIYRRHGIDLTIIDGGPEHPPAQYLRDGRADFAALWLTTALQRRSEGMALVNVAQIVPQSSMLLVALKSSGVRTLADLASKKVGLWGGDFDIPPRAVFDRNAIAVRVVQQSATVNLLLRGGVAATSAMWYNEYHTIVNSGVNPDELTVFALKDHGANYPEDGLYALQQTVDRDPQLVDAFVRASREGWDYAFDHPDEAVDVILRVMRQARLPANRMHQQWMLARLRDVMRGSSGTLGRADYRAVTEELQRKGLVHSVVDYDEFVRPLASGATRR